MCSLEESILVVVTVRITYFVSSFICNTIPFQCFVLIFMGKSYLVLICFVLTKSVEICSCFGEIQGRSTAAPSQWCWCHRRQLFTALDNNSVYFKKDGLRNIDIDTHRNLLALLCTIINLSEDNMWLCAIIMRNK